MPFFSGVRANLLFIQLIKSPSVCKVAVPNVDTGNVSLAKTALLFRLPSRLVRSLTMVTSRDW